jgi:hypothetical protein
VGRPLCWRVRRSWAKRFSSVLCTPRLCLQFVEQRLGFLEVRRVKALGEPAIDRCQEVAGFGPLALLLLESSEAGSCS